MIINFHQVPSRRAHDVKMTSYQRRCDVITSHRSLYDVILAPNAHWAFFQGTMTLDPQIVGPVAGTCNSHFK